MISLDNLKTFSKQAKINESTIYREYLQVLWLSKMYEFRESKNVFFKGGTSIHLLFKAPRFSEDLDFTSEIEGEVLDKLIDKTFKKVGSEADIEIKARESFAGKRYLITGLPGTLMHKTFINLDFSFLEKVLKPDKSIVETEYPVIFTSHVYHLSKDEILAEKIRAIMTRKKGRDYYDLWYLLSIGARLDSDLVKQKLKYYGLEKIKNDEILRRVDSFDKKDFVQDLKPFIRESERDGLPKLFEYIKDYLATQLSPALKR